MGDHSLNARTEQRIHHFWFSGETSVIGREEEQRSRRAKGLVVRRKGGLERRMEKARGD